jgi:hypothetical protein
MNPEVEMFKHKAFFRLKEDYKDKLWDICLYLGLDDDDYDKLRDLFVEAMNESYVVGEKRCL